MLETIGHCSLLYHADKYLLVQQISVSILLNVKYGLSISMSFLCNFQRWVLMIVAQASWVILGTLCPIIGYDVIDSREWSLSFLFRSYVGKARYTFFLHTNITLARIPPEISEISAFEAVLGILQAFVNWMHDSQMFLMTCVFGICPITIWIAVINFQNIVQSFGSITGNNLKISGAFLHDQFSELKGLADAINSVWHLFCFWYALDVMLWMATDLDYAFRTKDWFVKLHIFYFLFFCGTIMILSAESFRMVSFMLIVTAFKACASRHTKFIYHGLLDAMV